MKEFDLKGYLAEGWMFREGNAAASNSNTQTPLRDEVSVSEKREIRTADDLIQDMNRVLGPECMKACSDFQGNRIFYRLVCQPDWRQAQHLINSCKKYGAEVTEVPGDVLSPYKVRIRVQDGNICVTSKGRSSSIIYLSKGIFDKLPHGTCPKEPRTDDMGRRI